jgi:hypothetical protein
LWKKVFQKIQDGGWNEKKSLIFSRLVLSFDLAFGLIGSFSPKKFQAGLA